MRDESPPGDADRADYPEDPAVPKIAERMDLDAALARLPAHVRLCVVLAYSEGMSHSEISERRSPILPLGTVKSHITGGAPPCANGSMLMGKLASRQIGTRTRPIVRKGA